MLYYFPERADCGWGGYGIVPGTEAWLNGAFDGYLPPHELGHTFSLMHSSSLHCRGPGGAATVYSSECTTRTYGDFFDTMGGRYRHFNVFQKSRLRWLADCQLLKATESGSYELRSSNGPPSKNTLGLEIPFDSDRSLYVEHREPYGHFDDFAQDSPVARGVLLRLAPQGSGEGQSFLLDAHPETDDVEDAALAIGETFEALGLRLTLDSVEGGVARVTLELDASAPDPNVYCENVVDAPETEFPVAGAGGTGGGSPSEGGVGGLAGGSAAGGGATGSNSSGCNCAWPGDFVGGGENGAMLGLAGLALVCLSRRARSRVG